MSVFNPDHVVDAPADRPAIGTNTARIVDAGAHHGERTIRGRSLTVAVVSPADECPVDLDTAVVARSGVH